MKLRIGKIRDNCKLRPFICISSYLVPLKIDVINDKKCNVLDNVIDWFAYLQTISNEMKEH